MYVRFQNSKETFLAGQSVKKDIDKKPEEFRDRKLTDLSNAQVRRVVLKTPAGEMELEKKDTHWDILKPLRARADDQKVNDLISQVTSARIGQFVADDRGDLRPYGLAEPRGSITLFDQEQKKDQKVEIGESIKVAGREDKGPDAANRQRFPRKKKTRCMCGSLRAALFTRCRKKSKRSLTRSRPTCATTIWFGSTRTFSIGSRSTRRAKAKPFSRAKTGTGQSPAETMRRQIQAQFGA